MECVVVVATDSARFSGCSGGAPRSTNAATHTPMATMDTIVSASAHTPAR